MGARSLAYALEQYKTVDTSVHKSVLLQEAIEGLHIKDGDIVADGTLGGAGHSKLICQILGEKGTLIAIDQDEEALSRAEEDLRKTCKGEVHLIHDNFRNIGDILKSLEINNADKIILDLGLSSDQLEESGKGFSFQKDEPLTMCFPKKGGMYQTTAREIVNEWSAESIADILKGFGEERFAKRIANGIEARRAEKKIERTGDLVDVIRASVPGWYRRGKIHPATKTFQALRIAVNDELGALTEVLTKGFQLLSKDGRIAVISFHSIEDRIVKRFFRTKADAGLAKLITKKPITPTKQEILENPRARSAKLRIIEKTI